MVTPAELLAHASEKIRGRASGLVGQVRHPTRNGDTLRARVQGSEPAPYRVTVDLKRGRWACTCPDEYNAMCKHVGAVLLVAGDTPERFAPTPPARRLPNVQGWSDGDVEALLERLLEHHREVVTDWARVVAEERFEQEDDWE